MENTKLLTKKEVNQAHLFWWLAAETNNSYERLQALSFAAAMAKNLKKLYKDDPEGYKEALQRHMEFYNTEGTIGSSVVGITLAMEEEKVKNGSVSGEMITNIKIGLMGPIAGIGDTLIHGMAKSIILALACTFALEGNPIAILIPPLFALLVFGVGRYMCQLGYNLGKDAVPKLALACTFALEGNPIAILIPPLFALLVFGVGRYMCQLGYNLGKDAVPKLLKSGSMNSIITAASILGLFMMGSLASTYVKVSTPLAFTLDATGKVISLQENLDAILPGILQLLVIFGIYKYFSSKKQNYVVLILVILGVSILGAFLGILG